MRINFIEKIWPIIRSSKVLRTLFLLSVVFLMLVVVLLGVASFYRQEANANKDEVAKNEALLQNLQQIVSSEEKTVMQKNLFEKKSFASYDEVIPFIAYLENLFSSIDPQAGITIKSQEEQMFLDHFADYVVSVKIGENKELFFKAFDELHQSRFIIKVMSFVIGYQAAEDGKQNNLREANFVIRLFLK